MKVPCFLTAGGVRTPTPSVVRQNRNGFSEVYDPDKGDDDEGRLEDDSGEHASDRS